VIPSPCHDDNLLRWLAPLLILSLLLPGTGWAETPPAADGKALARADYLLYRRDYRGALRELGRLPKSAQEDRVVRHRTEQALTGLYAQRRRQTRKLRDEGTRLTAKGKISQKTRVTRRKHDADSGSDQDFDSRGWQVNHHLEATAEGRHPDQYSRFVVDLDGFRNGHNDLRYRTILADFYSEGNHLAFGDSASFGHPYFMRGSRVRGVNLYLYDETHEFQGILGAYPYWREDRDSYIYPRAVIGARDRFRLLNNKLVFGGGFLKTRDNERVRNVDLANIPRDNTVLFLEQQMKFIPNIWTVKAAEAFSLTDDALIEDHFGQKDKLRDSSFTVESWLDLPWFSHRGVFERVGPDFRMLGDIPSGFVFGSQITPDRMKTEHFFDLEPWWLFDLDLQASWYRNDLDHDSEVEMTRQAWYTADLGVLVPEGWPKPRIRANWVETISTPGPTTRPDETRRMDLRTELTHRWNRYHITAFGTYFNDVPQTEEHIYNDEYRWSLGTRISRPVGERMTLTGRYQYSSFEEDFNEIRQRGIEHETGISGSIRLVSTSSLSLGYSMITGKLIDPSQPARSHGTAHQAHANFGWPLTRWTWNRRRKFTLHPAVNFHMTDASRDLQRRPIASGRLGLSYEAIGDWKLEFRSEFRWDNDYDDQTVRTEQNRFWLLWSSNWQ